MTVDTLKQVIDNMATDATMFDVSKNKNRRAIPKDGAFFRLTSV
jgi:hypothetical protein